MTQTGTDETKVLENRRACAKREVECKAAALYALGSLTKADIRAAIETHLQKVEGGTLAGVLTPSEIKDAIKRGERMIPQTVTATASETQSRPVEVVGTPQTTTSNKGILLSDWLVKEIPAVDFLIDGVLPMRGRLLISGEAKIGKTYFGSNLALSIAGGASEYAGFKIPRAVRVAYCQPELPDFLFRERLRRMLENPPAGLDPDLAARNLVYFQTQEGRPNLSTDAGRQEVRAMLDAFRPDICIFDPCYALNPGMKENDADAVSLFLNYLSDLAASGPAAVLIHHFGKSKTNRGSSVFEGWPDAALTLTAKGDFVEMGGIFRYSVGIPRVIERTESGWFSLVPEDRLPSPKAGRPKEDAAGRAVAILKQVGGRAVRHDELVGLIRAQFSCGESSAKQAVKDATAAGLVLKTTVGYCLSGGSEN